MRYIIKINPSKSADTLRILKNLGATDIQVCAPDTYCMEMDKGTAAFIESIYAIG
jgi:hypothetical protein